METLTLEKRVLEAPHVHELSTYQPAISVGTESRLDEPAQQTAGTTKIAGAVALAGEVVHPATPTSAERPRYGYRQDSPPEVIALLHEAQAGDKEGFAELYRLHLDRVSRYVTARMWDEDRQAIPDVVQDAFCEALADLGNAHHDVKGWFLAHAAKAYIRHARSGRKQERAIIGAREAVRRVYAYGHVWDERPVNSGEVGISDAVTVIGRLSLVRALARLAPNQRRCIQHRYLEGQTQATTANLMGKTLKAVKSAEHRALVKLREGLAAPALKVTT